MHHEHHTDRTCGEAPRGLPNHGFLVLLVQKLDIEHFGKVLPEIMRGGGLNRTAVGRHEGFHSGSKESASEFFVLGFNLILEK